MIVWGEVGCALAGPAGWDAESDFASGPAVDSTGWTAASGGVSASDWGAENAGVAKKMVTNTTKNGKKPAKFDRLFDGWHDRDKILRDITYSLEPCWARRR